MEAADEERGGPDAVAQDRPRTYVVTGASSGIGRATVIELRAQGHRVIGVARRTAEVQADLLTTEGRASLRPRVEELAGPVIDAVIACAGGVAATAADVVRLNYFAAVSTLTELQPLLARSDAPRALAITSIAALRECDEAITLACLAGDEGAAMAAASVCDQPLWPYRSTKRALTRWVRRTAMTREWAGMGITLNALAPGLVVTPLNREAIEAGHQDTLQYGTTMLGGPWQTPQIVSAMTWLVSAGNHMVTGQCLWADGGVEARERGDGQW